MLFFLIRILPFALPVLYFFELKGLFYFFDWWQAFLAAVIAGNLLDFAVIKFKNRRQPVAGYFCYTSAYLALGFVFSMILENAWVINIFSVIWALLYLILLEAYFYDVYESSRADLLNLREIIPYVNLIMVFFLSSILYYFNIFLSFPWYWAGLIFLAALLVIFRQFFRFQPLEGGYKTLYGLIGSLALCQCFVSLFFLPLSFYVLGALNAIAFFLFISLSLSYIGKNLNFKSVARPVAMCVLILALILATAAWL